jgi:hypothetical protein
MNQEKMDQGWHELESHINQLVGKFLRNDFPAIEHKPSYLALLQLPSDYKIEELENIS